MLSVRASKNFPTWTPSTRAWWTWTATGMLQLDPWLSSLPQDILGIQSFGPPLGFVRAVKFNHGRQLKKIHSSESSICSWSSFCCFAFSRARLPCQWPSYYCLLPWHALIVCGYILEVISKKFFGPISVLVPCFNSSEYCSMPAVEVRSRLELEPKPFFWDGF